MRAAAAAASQHLGSPSLLAQLGNAAEAAAAGSRFKARSKKELWLTLPRKQVQHRGGGGGGSLNSILTILPKLRQAKTLRKGHMAVVSRC